MKFTNATIGRLALPAGKTDYAWWDDDLPGFGIRLRGATARWIVQYRVPGRQRREVLGDIRKVSLDDARKAARQRFAQVELGIDPGAERDRARRNAIAGALTLAVVTEKYLAAKTPTARPATLRASVWHLTGLWAPLRHKPVGEIKRADVAARVGEIVKTSGPVSAARARGTLGAMYSWAMREGLCEANPTVATNDPSNGLPSRSRTLTDSELRTVWRASLDDVGDFGAIVQLLILTGCRRSEIGDLRWSEIDLSTGLLTIPGERVKSHRTLELTLPPMALGILRGIPRRRGDHVFGRRDSGFQGWSYAFSQLNLQIAKVQPLAHWQLHDLRRTTRSGLSRLGVRPDVAERVIGHRAAGTVEAIYDRHSYRGEIADALARWAAHVESVIA